MMIVHLFGTIAKFVKNEQIIALVEQQQSSLIIYLIIYQLAVVLLVSFISIYVSHKIAGPLHKLHKFFRKIADGNPPERLFFRKADYFKFLAEDFNDAFDKVNETHIQDLAYLSEVQSYIQNLALVIPDDKKPVLEEISARLNEIQERFNNR